MSFHWRLTSDRYLVAATTIVCSVVAGVYLYGWVDHISQAYGPETDWFTPSLMFAAGRGLATPVPDSVPGLPEFMRQETLSFDVSSIPDSVQTWDLSSFCQTHRYLLYVVGWVWWLLGASWHTIKIVPWLAITASVPVMFGLFRLVSKARIAALATAFTLLSPPVLAMLPSVRDFCKMPFFLAVLLLVAHLATRPLSHRAWLLKSLGLGMVCGIGLGFRQDFLVCVPLGMLAAAILPDSRHAMKINHRIVAAALVPMGFLATGFPVFHAVLEENGAVSSHSLAQGLSADSFARLGLGNASYDLLQSPDDAVVHATITNYAERTGLEPHSTQYLDRAYGEAGRAFFRENALTFPYDLALRAFAAVAASFRLMSEAPVELQHMKHFDNGFIRVMGSVYWPASLLLSVLAPWLAVVFVIGLAGYNVRLATTLLFVTLFFTGYTSVLFQYRHGFHLAFVAPWFVAAVVNGLLPKSGQAGQEVFSKRRAALWTLAMIVAVAVSLGTLALVQSNQTGRMFHQIAQATLREIMTASSTDDSGQLFRVADVQFTSADENNLMDTPAAYLAVRLSRPEEFELVYDASEGGNDLSRTMLPPRHLENHDGGVTVYMPIYLAATWMTNSGESPEGVNMKLRLVRPRFVGLRFETGSIDAVEGIYQVSDAGQLSLHPFVWIAPGESAMRWHVRPRW